MFRKVHEYLMKISEVSARVFCLSYLRMVTVSFNTSICLFVLRQVFFLKLGKKITENKSHRFDIPMFIAILSIDIYCYKPLKYVNYLKIFINSVRNNIKDFAD